MQPDPGLHVRPWAAAPFLARRGGTWSRPMVTQSCLMGTWSCQSQPIPGKWAPWQFPAVLKDTSLLPAALPVLVRATPLPVLSQSHWLLNLPHSEGSSFLARVQWQHLCPLALALTQHGSHIH